MSLSFHAHDGCLAYRPAPSIQLLVLVLVALRPADVGLIHFDRAGEGVGPVVQCLADAVGQMPCCLLRDAQIAVELHAGYALQMR